MDYTIKQVIQRVNKLDSKEKLHILNILKQTSVGFSKNTNGYFFNLSNISDDTLNKIVKCLNLIETNRDLIKELDTRREELLKFYKSLIEDKLLASLRDKRERYVNKIRVVYNYSNVQLMVKRHVRMQKKRINNDNIDPDILIKEYNTKAKNKLKKGSVYQRIVAKMKSLKSNKYIAPKDEHEYTQHVEKNDSCCSEDIENDNDDMKEDSFAEDDLFIDGDDIPNDNDNDNDNDNENENDIENDNENENDIENENENDDVEKDISETNDNDNDMETTPEEKDEQSKRHEQNISYFKKLLYQQGFTFEEPHDDQPLVREPYIH